MRIHNPAGPFNQYWYPVLDLEWGELAWTIVIGNDCSVMQVWELSPENEELFVAKNIHRRGYRQEEAENIQAPQAIR